MDPTGTPNEQENQLDFLREQIKQRPINKKRLIRRTLITVALAVVFGLVACFAFIVFLPFINNRLYPEEPPQVVSFPEENNEMQPEEMVALDTEIEAGAVADDPSESMQNTVFDQLMNAYDYSAGDYERLYGSLARLAQESAKSLVTLTVQGEGTDFGGNPLINTAGATGLVIADNGVETLILTPASALARAQEITVTFCDGAYYTAQIKSQDISCDLCVLSVDNAEIADQTKEAFVIAELDSSAYSAKPGAQVIALGSPTGVADSVCYGNITADNAAIDLADTAFKRITTDIYASPQASGVLIDLRGRVIGWIDMRFNPQDVRNQLSAVGISELKPLISRLSNGGERAHFGVHGVNVPPEVKATQEIPDGAYITGIEMDSPAMNVGIQSGDIIAQASDVAIADYTALCSLLLNHDPEDVLHLHVLRASGGTYREMELDVTLR